MRNWILFLSLCLLISAYGIHASWKHFSESHSETQAVLATNSATPASLHATASQERRLVNASMHVLQQSHLIFAESWRLLVGSSSTPNSAMKALSAHLGRHLSPDLISVLPNQACPFAHEDFVFVKSFATSTSEIDLQHNDCHSNLTQSVAEIKWTGFENGKDSSKLVITFHPDQISEGVGESMALLNRNISCDYVIGNDDRVLNMSCRELGLGLTRAEHYSFSKFEYQADKNELLTVEADHYKNLMEKMGCVSDQPCLKLSVPLLGKIKFVENRKMGKNKLAEMPPLNPAPAPLVPPMMPVEAQLPTAMNPHGENPEDSQLAAEQGFPQEGLVPPQMLPGLPGQEAQPQATLSAPPPLPVLPGAIDDQQAQLSSANSDVINPVSENNPQNPGENNVQSQQQFKAAQEQNQEQNQSQVPQQVQGQNQGSSENQGQEQQEQGQLQDPTQNAVPEAVLGASQQQGQSQVDGRQEPVEQGLPSENPAGSASPELQPPVNSAGPADLQSRQPSGQ